MGNPDTIQHLMVELLECFVAKENTDKGLPKSSAGPAQHVT